MLAYRWYRGQTLNKKWFSLHRFDHSTRDNNVLCFIVGPYPLMILSWRLQQCSLHYAIPNLIRVIREWIAVIYHLLRESTSFLGVRDHFLLVKFTSRRVRGRR